MNTTTDATRSIGGFHVQATTTVDLLARLSQRRLARTKTELLFANTNFVVTCGDLASQVAGSETLIVNDGIGLDLASWLFHARFFPENLNGTDFTPRLLASLDRPTRIFLLGAKPSVIRAVAERWSTLRHVEVVGAVDGFDGMADDDALLARLRDAAPDILFLALGDPLQARWIVSHRQRHDVPLVIGVGALFDFVSGDVRRAPAWVRRLRCEWLYRLATEPRRLLKRYTVDLVVFFAHCLKARRAGRPVGQRA